MNSNYKSTKKEEIVSRAIQILTTHLTETNEIQKIKQIVCNNTSINSVENQIKYSILYFHPSQ
jgi:hypothetical protein